MSGLGADQARDLAARMAGAAHSRRVYSTATTMWARTLGALHTEIDGLLGRGVTPEVSFALLGEGIAVCGVPIHAPPDQVQRFVERMRERAVEVISILPGAAESELEALLVLLSTDLGELAGIRPDAWLKERGVERVRVKNLKLLENDELASFRDVFRRGVDAVGDAFGQAARRGAVSGAAIAELAQGLMDVVIDGEAPVATLLALRDRQDYSMVHSVNVGVLATCQAVALGLEPQRVQEISAAGLLHDVGKTRVPEGILQKQSPLTPQERELLDRHTLEGARILTESRGIDGRAAIVAFSHHRFDGAQSLLGTEIVRLADTFDVLRSLRPFDEAEGAKGAVAFLIHHLRNRFNPYLLERLATLCGLFSAGEVHRLTTGEIAKVVAPHAELALRPRVEILEPGQGGGAVGQIVDLTRPPAGVAPALMIPPLPASFAGLGVEDVDRVG